jgi:YrbI family 3-deoxy-D-manno-octulosonate 8-phosphate phosphatase
MDVDGVLTDSGMYYTNQGDELKKFNTRDGQGIALLQKAGIKTGIITRENTNIVAQRAAKLKVDYLFQGVTNKLDVIEKLLEENKQTSMEVCYIGDDLHDVEALQFAGYAVVPEDATYECRVIADYVCRCKGGEGCVREVANKLLSNQNNHE